MKNPPDAWFPNTTVQFLIELAFKSDIKRLLVAASTLFISLLKKLRFL